jgi:hypothetical protein
MQQVQVPENNSNKKVIFLMNFRTDYICEISAANQYRINVPSLCSYKPKD